MLVISRYICVKSYVFCHSFLLLVGLPCFFRRSCCYCFFRCPFVLSDTLFCSKCPPFVHALVWSRTSRLGYHHGWVDGEPLRLRNKRSAKQPIPVTCLSPYLHHSLPTSRCHAHGMQAPKQFQSLKFETTEAVQGRKRVKQLRDALRTREKEVKVT